LATSGSSQLQIASGKQQISGDAAIIFHNFFHRAVGDSLAEEVRLGPELVALDSDGRPTDGAAISVAGGSQADEGSAKFPKFKS
jgi:hypothetical protein